MQISFAICISSKCEPNHFALHLPLMPSQSLADQTLFTPVSFQEILPSFIHSAAFTFLSAEYMHECLLESIAQVGSSHVVLLLSPLLCHFLWIIRLYLWLYWVLSMAPTSLSLSGHLEIGLLFFTHLCTTTRTWCSTCE